MRSGRPPKWFIFFARHVMEPSDGCRLWPGMLDQDGYGRFVMGDREHRVNILTCQVWHGPMPHFGLVAAHSCGNSRCWAGEHLRWATNSENTLDKNVHGTMPRGERHHKAKLTEADVLAMRESFALGGITKADLARRYSVCPQTVSSALERKTWIHI